MKTIDLNRPGDGIRQSVLAGPCLGSCLPSASSALRVVALLRHPRNYAMTGC